MTETGQIRKRRLAAAGIALGILAMGWPAAMAQFPGFPGLGTADETVNGAVIWGQKYSTDGQISVRNV